jgi:hypothetical protein
MEPEGSLPSLQELFTCTYPEPNQSSLQHSINFFLFFSLQLWKKKEVLVKSNHLAFFQYKLHGSI